MNFCDFLILANFVLNIQTNFIYEIFRKNSNGKKRHLVVISVSIEAKIFLFFFTVETIKEPLEFKLEILDAKDLTVEQLEISRQKLMELDARDQAKVEREQALNNLETAVR